MLKIGITGGIGSGKSFIATVFNHLSVPVYNADKVAKQLIETNLDLKRQIIDLLGSEAYDKAGKYNTKYVSSRVFNNTVILKALNQLVHPAVRSDFDIWCQENKTKPYILKEAALLVETQGYKDLDGLIVVLADLDTRILRIQQRDSWRSTDEITNIINNQLSDEDRLRHADYVVYNDLNKMLLPQIISLHEKFLFKNSFEI